MKLRIKDNSIRLRVTRSELASLGNGGRIEASLRFSHRDSDVWTYALQTSPGVEDVAVAFQGQGFTIRLPEHEVAEWHQSDNVGIYSTQCVTETLTLEVAVEKDFACLDQSDADNEDTFPNPMMNVC